MANAYPQAMGLAAAFPKRQVIAMCGDGGVTVLMGDLLTLVQERLPVKLLIFNNGTLGFVEMEQRKVTAGEVASTAMFGVKAVLNGRASEVVSLLRDNFLK